ncbi:hypothetical protein PENPOL_c018G10228 [Penicillium polonicum]|uniref:Uncharacterized protein n=1 Tax=Penicillium polonicum TaxID=60169 RepID=A0A1V6N953_PENPO|nr:hypothetical protein PENPOL_c018G10228 [Penicillium polonicum]
MASNITNIISIVVNALPASTHLRYPIPPISLCLQDREGFWGLMIVAARFPAAGAGYLLWRRPTSKGEDLEDASPKDVTAGEQPKDTREKIPAGDDIEAQTPKTPAPSTTPKKKKRLGSAKIASLSTVARNTAHGVREVFSPGQH